MAYLYQLDNFEIIPQPTSHLYYCYRKIFDQKITNHLMLCENIHYQMIKTAWFYKDQEIARQKLIWWLEELKNTFEGKPQHPLSKKLNQANLSDHIKHKLIELNEYALGFIVYDSDITSKDMLIKQLVNYFFTFEKLKAIGLGVDDEDQLIKLAAEIEALVQYIYFFPELLKRNLLIPKEKYLKQLDIDIKNLYNYQMSQALKNWFESLFLEVEKKYKTFQLALNSNNKKCLKPIIINLKILRKILKETRKHDYNLFNIEIKLSPIQMLMQSI